MQNVFAESSLMEVATPEKASPLKMHQTQITGYFVCKARDKSCSDYMKSASAILDREVSSAVIATTEVTTTTAVVAVDKKVDSSVKLRCKMLEKWKLHAERLGTEAPSPQAGPAPPVRIGRLRRKQRDVKVTCKASFDEVKQNVEVKERTKRPRKYADEAEKAAQHALDTDVVSFETLQHVLDQMVRRGRCIGRIWADGWGCQCAALCVEGQDMCIHHVKGDRWKTHGRFDGDLPPAKELEMAATQRKWVKQGKRPPPCEPWTKLVDLP